MVTAAKSGHGTTISYATNAVGECMITGPELSVDQLDATTNSSTSAWREFISGLKDGGEVTLEGNYVPADAGQAALRSGLGGTAGAVVITYPSALGTCSFNAVVSAFAVQSPHDEKVTFSATLKISGAVTYA